MSEQLPFASLGLALLSSSYPNCHRNIGDDTEGEFMGDRVWQVPQEQFVAAWNGVGSLDEAAARVKELARGNVPRWAVMARAQRFARTVLR